MLLGTDISDHNGLPDFARLAADGIAFVVVKVTGGDRYVNPLWRQQYDGARAAGLAVGLYHYDAEPTVHTGTPEAEAAWFLAQLPAPLPPDVFLALDAEERATRDPARYRHWLDLVRAGAGRSPLLYTYHDFITAAPAVDWVPVADAPLWYAWYPGDSAPVAALAMPTPPAPWTKATIWQYSGGTTLVGEVGPFDLDRFDGTPGDLAALGAPVSAAGVPLDNPGFPGALQPDGSTRLNTVDFGGVAVTVEKVVVVVRNAAGVHYQRTWSGYALGPWEIV